MLSSSGGGPVSHTAVQTGDVVLRDSGLAGGLVAGLPHTPSLAMYHGSWPLDKGEDSL